MPLLILVLELLALGCFVAAAIGATARVNLVAAGLAFWMLTLVILRG